MSLTVGTEVAVKDTYRDEKHTIPLVGTIEDIIPNGYPDENGHYDGVARYVVMFGDTDRMMPPGGEFLARALVPVERLGH